MRTKSTPQEHLLDLRSFDKLGIASIIFFICAIILGGGGSRFPMSEMIIYLSALPALYFAIFASRQDGVSASNAERSITILIIALLGLILLQVIPLPAFLWQAMPGRENLAEISALVDEEGAWRSWSIDPSRTLYSALYLIAPITAYTAVRKISLRQQRMILAIMLIVAALHLVVAFAQAASGGEAFYLYKTSHIGLPIGLFANRNHSALLLLVIMIMMAPLICRTPSKISMGQLMVYWIFALILSIGILATSSRAVTILWALTLVMMVLTFIPKSRRRLGFIGVGISSILGTVIIGALAVSGKLGNLSSLVERFQQSDDHRYEFWPDTIQTLLHFLPFGSGLGTFDAAFRSQETLEIVGSHFVNHAHNDYIEIGIELGAFGLVILFFFFKTIFGQAKNIFMDFKKGERPALPLYALGSLSVTAIHSLVDYPARSISIAVFCGALIAIITQAEHKVKIEE